eukprot:CAMPEP_0167760154 /NCGR_PEP_ID=MMETSP0110_2-20121227/11430_1 /TAXON_ID=629695 /ORGANISM="Gymnochlora sp., Strain CCMP2014" /LENGTH=729 /DNA_ID=CAMNT_0007646637 /DNA_START=771 /DNA_END=2959 /DNA_ORIENTATION=-
MRTSIAMQAVRVFSLPELEELQEDEVGHRDAEMQDEGALQEVSDDVDDSALSVRSLNVSHRRGTGRRGGRYSSSPRDLIEDDDTHGEILLRSSSRGRGSILRNGKGLDDSRSCTFSVGAPRGGRGRSRGHSRGSGRGSGRGRGRGRGRYSRNSSAIDFDDENQTIITCASQLGEELRLQENGVVNSPRPILESAIHKDSKRLPAFSETSSMRDAKTDTGLLRCIIAGDHHDHDLVLNKSMPPYVCENCAIERKGVGYECHVSDYKLCVDCAKHIHEGRRAAIRGNYAFDAESAIPKREYGAVLSEVKPMNQAWQMRHPENRTRPHLAGKKDFLQNVGEELLNVEIKHAMWDNFHNDYTEEDMKVLEERNDPITVIMELFQKGALSEFGKVTQRELRLSPHAQTGYEVWTVLKAYPNAPITKARASNKKDAKRSAYELFLGMLRNPEPPPFQPNFLDTRTQNPYREYRYPATLPINSKWDARRGEYIIPANAAHSIRRSPPKPAGLPPRRPIPRVHRITPRVQRPTNFPHRSKISSVPMQPALKSVDNTTVKSDIKSRVIRPANKARPLDNVEIIQTVRPVNTISRNSMTPLKKAVSLQTPSVAVPHIVPPSNLHARTVVYNSIVPAANRHMRPQAPILRQFPNGNIQSGPVVPNEFYQPVKQQQNVNQMAKALTRLMPYKEAHHAAALAARGGGLTINNFFVQGSPEGKVANSLKESKICTLRSDKLSF